MRLVQVTPVYTPPVMPACRAILTANQTIASGAWLTINLNAVSYDTAGDFDVINHRWVCSEAGIYMIITNISMVNITDGTIVGAMIRINGSSHSPFYRDVTGGTIDPSYSGSDIWPMSVNDRVQMFAVQTSGIDKLVKAGANYYTSLIIYRLS